ncbi:MAG: thiamine pyrophosphate-binding protein [Gemmataceae bacterium]|nr:thiamine pyrophosphate-binding protein [Gemmataceae bacterium]MDW8266609.1 thiamine pyrophosphate-binding protein [Gemmataceae bacterium]
MGEPLSRRDLLKTFVAQGVAATPLGGGASAEASPPGWISGKMTGAEAICETLLQEGADCVFGIPGAQGNELWDTMKSKGVGYLLVAHEFSAACMADGAARATGKPGVLCVVPGPGITNALTGLGEALLDSVPVVAIVIDIARGCRYRPFQVHSLPSVPLLEPVTKGVIAVGGVGDIPLAIRQAFRLACSGEPGPVAVVVPYHLLIEAHKFHVPPVEPPPLPWDEAAFQRALCLLATRWQVGIYAGLGCMDHSAALVRVAEMLQAPVATSISGKGVIPECHPLAVGWGYGPQGTETAEAIFKKVNLVLAIGVRYSEVSTGFYSIPSHRVVHVDINPHNLGAVVKAAVCVPADAGVFLHRLLQCEAQLRRPPDPKLLATIQKHKADEAREHAKVYARCAADPMAFVLALRRRTSSDALVFVDVTMCEHWAGEAFTVFQPRTYFNPANNQSMGWSIPAAIGAQRGCPGRQVVTITGDGCFLMSAMEISTAAREGLPVKFFVLDDQAYHYMQALQKPAYLRTTATVLARLNYAALAQGLGVGYHEICRTEDLDAGIQTALCLPGPVLTRVVVDYGKRPVRWIKAARERFTDELCADQKVRFLARLAARTVHCHKDND